MNLPTSFAPAVCAGLALWSAAPAGAQCQEYTRTGQAFDQYGWSAAVAGDVDADGVADFIVGAPQDAGLSAGAGYATVYSSRSGRVLHVLAGTLPDGSFGRSVDGAGDADGDGFADLIVGAPGANEVYLFAGVNGTLLHRWIGPPDGGFGAAVSGAGDLDRDGFADVLVGSPLELTTGFAGGVVRAYSGRDGSLLREVGSPDYRDYFGSALDELGDLDGDGTPEFIVGASGDNFPAVNAGAAFVYSGRSGGLLYEFHGFAAGDDYGRGVAGVGDLDLDGVVEFAVAAPLSFGGLGAVQVYSGASGQPLLFLRGQGTEIAPAGDFDGDGRGDLIVGTPFDGPILPAAGAATVFSGFGEPLHTFHGSAAGELFGAAVAGLGDLTGDGRAEVLIGAPGDDLAGDDAGRVTVFSCSAFVLTGPLPGIAGVGNSLILNGATPGAAVSFAFGTELGATPVPGCGGLSLGIAPVRVAQTAFADASGRASVSFFVPAARAGMAGLFQVVEPGACRVSDLIVHVFR